MTRRSELKGELKRLEKENELLQDALLKRVNMFLHSGSWLGTYYYTVEVLENGEAVKVHEYYHQNTREMRKVQMSDHTFEVQAAMIAAKQVDDRNQILTSALTMLAERAWHIDKLLLDVGAFHPNREEWQATVKAALLTSTNPEALRVARLLGGEE